MRSWLRCLAPRYHPARRGRPTPADLLRPSDATSIPFVELTANVIGDQAPSGSARMMEMLSSPKAAQDGLGDGCGVAMLMEQYRELRRDFGSIEGCITDALGIDAETRQTL